MNLNIIGRYDIKYSADFLKNSANSIKKFLYTPIANDGLLLEKPSDLSKLREIYGLHRVKAWCRLAKHIHKTEIESGKSIYPYLTLDTGKDGTLLDFILWTYQNDLKTGHSCQGTVNKQTHILAWDGQEFSVRANTHNDYHEPYRSLPYITLPKIEPRLIFCNSLNEVSTANETEYKNFKLLKSVIRRLTDKDERYKFSSKGIHLCLYAQRFAKSDLEFLLKQVMNELNNNPKSGFKPINYNYEWPSLA